ncbi:MAG: N-6 DNA methylase [Gammaproteobacteria bacterium]|nr:N-6 DNA methylase [Gammaproteobacteria bacterium]
MARRSRPRESAARKVIDGVLARLGWITDERRQDCNVFTEGAKTRDQSKKLERKQPDYVLYEQGTDTPIAVIEAKRPGHTLKKAVEDAVRLYARPLGIDIVFATDGVLCQTFDRRSNTALFLDGEPVVELLAPKILARFAAAGPKLVTPTKVRQTKQQLMSVFAQANGLLRKEGLRAGLERFGEFSTLLFLKLISEIEADRDSRGEARRLEARYCWEAFASKSPAEMLDYLNDTVLPRLVRSYNHSGDVFNRRLSIANPNTLAAVVARLSDLSLLDAESDVKGDAFEYFLKNSVTVGNDLGEYFTPRHIVKLMVDLVDPAYMEQVYDPCCGTGGFLIEAFRHVSRKVKLTKTSRRVLENETIFGRELTGSAKIAKMNMILAGDGHTHIHQKDSLESPVDSEYDVVLTNFPFSQETDHGGLYGLDTVDANPVFLKHVVDSCAKGGRIGVIVPEGLLFADNQQYEHVRRYVVDNCEVVAVVALDEYVFRPYTGQPTAILVLNKGRASSKPIWFYEVLDDGFEKTTSKKGRKPTGADDNDLVVLRSVWSTRPDGDQSFFVDVDTVRENGHKLSLSSYRPLNDGVERSSWVPLGGDEGICEIRLGATPSTDVEGNWEGTNAWVTISDMRDRYVTSTERTISDLGVASSSVKLLPKGTVLVSFKLTIGKVAIAGCDLYTNEAIAGLVPKDHRVLPEYLYFLIPSINLRHHMQPAAKGKTLNKKILESIRVPVPSKKEQRAFIRRMNQLEAKAIGLREEAQALDQETVTTGRAFVDAMR